MRQGEGGQALVELAISSLVLILILFGVIDLARVFNVSTALQEAARVGARHGALYDGSLNVNPFLCDVKRAGSCPFVGSSTFPSNDGIKDEVDRVLQGTGLSKSQTCPSDGLTVTGTGTPSCLRTISGSKCPGSTPYNPPYSDSTLYPTTVNQPWVYICYNTETTNFTQDNAGRGSPQAAAPSCGGDTGTCGGFDLMVVVLMKFPLVINSIVGPSFPIAGYSHIRVQGS